MRAPAAMCAACRGVVFRGASVGSVPFSADIWWRTPADNGASRRGRPRHPAPPLSLGLRDFGPPLFGVSPAPSASAPEGTLLSSVHQPVAVLLPERFRGGCAFGSGAPAVVSRLPISPARVGARDAGLGWGSQGWGGDTLQPIGLEQARLTFS